MTDVPWATKHWRVIAGCTKKSRGCAHCFAARLAATRLKHHPAYQGLADLQGRSPRCQKPRPDWTGEVRCFPDQLTEPLRRRKPTTYFVAEMGDLFHELVPFEFIAAVFGVMAATPRHTYVLLTKRAKRMAEWFHWVEHHPTGLFTRHTWPNFICARAAQDANPEGMMPGGVPLFGATSSWPLPNVWPGVSVEGQRELDERTSRLVDIPVHEDAGRWLSVEPQIEHVDLDPWRCDAWHSGGVPCDVHHEPGCQPWCVEHDSEAGSLGWLDEIKGVIQGCESGPGRRPFDIEWAISMHQQCQNADVAYYLKQVPGLGNKVDKEPGLYGRKWRELPWAT